jgi:signal transduction histidine kinase
VCIATDRIVANFIIRKYLVTPELQEKAIKIWAERSIWFIIVIWLILIFIYFSNKILFTRLHAQMQQNEELIERLKNTNTELQNLNQSKDKFLLSLSHEFRNPINAVMGNLELALDRV